MGKIAVIGGGIAGLVASLLLAKKGYQVALIEKEESCGGLLRSFKNENGVTFDFGTHILSETMIRELDEVLFGDLENDGWNKFEILMTGNFFEGILYKKNQMIYTPFLPEEVYQKGILDLLQTEPFDEAVHNLKEYTEKQFGQTFSQHIFAPLMRKLQGCELEELHQDAHRLFGYTRLIIANENASRELKKSPFYDEKLSFASYNEGISPSQKYYPNNGDGIGNWTERLAEKLLDEGVSIKTGRLVSQVVKEGNEVTAIVLDNGEVVDCDYVIWTLAPFGLLKAASIPFIAKAPEFRKMSLHHFVFDKPFLTDNHYVYCNDPELNSFRVTLYPNITNSIEGPFNCTVEVLSGLDNSVEEMNEVIKRELVTMGIVDKNANTGYQLAHGVQNGFPVYSNEYVDTLNRQREIVTQSFSNVSMIGKGSGTAFFMNEVLIQVYREVERIVAEKSTHVGLYRCEVENYMPSKFGDFI